MNILIRLAALKAELALARLQDDSDRIARTVRDIDAIERSGR